MSELLTRPDVADVQAAQGDASAASPPGRHPGQVLAALAMGGFAIGTTEFAAMSLAGC